MARILRKICFITIVFLVAVSIKTYANELTIESQDSINLENENMVECVLKGDFTNKVNSIKVRYTSINGVEFEGFTPSGEWILEEGGTKETTGLVLRINDKDLTGEVEFGKFIFKVPSTYSEDKISLKVYDLDATNTSCEILDFDNAEVIKDIKIAKEDDDTFNKGENDETNTPSDDKNETDDGKDKTDGNIEAPKDDNNSDGDLGTNNNSNNNQNDFENDMSTNQGDKENINSDNINNNNNIDKTPSKTPFGQYGESNIIIIILLVVATIGFIVHKKLKKIKFIK